jgi:hypothetical protein
MERCGWCDTEFDIDDWLDEGERKCDEHSQRFCSTECQKEHEQDCLEG